FPTALRRPSLPGEPLCVHDPFDIWDLEDRLSEAGYQVLHQLPESNGHPVRFAVVSRIDAGGARFTEQGGSVLLLAGSPTDIDPAIVARTGVRVRDRPVRLGACTEETLP